MTTRRSAVSEPHLVAQVAGGFVAADVAARAAAESVDIARQEAAMNAARHEVGRVRDFIGSPEKIVGNPTAKHGEVAERVEVGIRRARQVLEGLKPTATIDGLPRNGPIDYVIDGVDVQSKFINSVPGGFAQGLLEAGWLCASPARRAAHLGCICTRLTWTVCAAHATDATCSAL